MDNQKRVVEEEIRSILRQYQAEVGHRRKPWPNALKTRILELSRLGVRQRRLVEITGISYQTILNWRKDAGLFVEKKAQPEKFHRLPVRVEKPRAKKGGPLTVIPPTVSGMTVRGKTVGDTSVGNLIVMTTPEGFRLEFSSLDQAVEFMQKMRGINAL